MKYLVITDTHMGSMNDDPVLHAMMFDFYENTMIPYMKKHGIESILHLGDFFYSRKALSVQTIKYTNQFIALLEEHKIAMIMILGNHDIVYNTSSELSAATELLSDHFAVYSETISLPNGIDLIPWINNGNRQDFEELLITTSSKIAVGHFDILGAKFAKHGMVSHHGLDPAMFKHYDMVLSGHFHTKSDIGNIHYLGSPFQFTWADWNDTKYFHVLDTKTAKLDAIPSGCNLFYKVSMDEFGDQIIPHTDSIEGKIVRCEVFFDDVKEMETRLEVIRAMKPYKMDVVLMASNSESQNKVVDINKVGGIQSVISDYVTSCGASQEVQSKVLSYINSKMEQ